MSEDTDVHGINWYIYADDNPITNVDATGKKTISMLQWLADFGWWNAGEAFTAAAISFIMARTVPGFAKAVAKANTVACSCAVAAVTCFGMAAMGLDGGNVLYYENFMAILATGVGTIFNIVTTQSMAMSGGWGAGVACVAVAAAFTDALVTLGYVESIGCDIE